MVNPESSSPPAKKQKTTNDSSSPPPPLIDIAAIEKLWTPNRSERIVTREKKVRSAAAGPLQGGDWILNENGDAATLSFCFEYQDQYYGLSVGHLADIGESIFCFAEDEMEDHPVPDGDVFRGKSYPMWEIGTVVSKSLATDSLVFEINFNVSVEIAEPKTLAAASGLDRPMDLPDPTVNTPRPEKKSLLIGFGAQRRGAVGKVAIPSLKMNGQYSRPGNIALIHRDDPQIQITDAGDCGTIFVGLDGTPFYFHHCANEHFPKYSYGFPLAQVMSCHTELGGTAEQKHQIRQLSSPSATGMEDSELAREICELKHFETHVVSTPLSKQNNSLANFNVHAVDTPKKQKEVGAEKGTSLP